MTNAPHDLKEVAEKWWTPPAGIVAKLPRVTCKACTKKTCTEHTPVKCGVCQAFISPRHIHLDFVGHADLTRALIEIDPQWQWEPVSFDEGGSPRITQRGDMWVLWGRLTLLGKSMLCVGTCEVSALKTDVDKELVGDMLRNGGMRFGIFGALWSKTDGWHDDESSNETAPPVVGQPDAPTIVGPRIDTGVATSSTPVPDPYALAAANKPTKPIAAMTVRELNEFANKLHIPYSGTKTDMIRTLEPYVLAATGEEPFEVTTNAAPKDGAAEELALKPEPIPFNPKVASDRKQVAAVAAAIREGR